MIFLKTFTICSVNFPKKLSSKNYSENLEKIFFLEKSQVSKFFFNFSKIDKSVISVADFDSFLIFNLEKCFSVFFSNKNWFKKLSHTVVFATRYREREFEISENFFSMKT